MSTVNKRNSTRRCSCFTSLLVQLTFMIRGQVRILNNVKVSTETGTILQIQICDIGARVV